MLQSYTHQVEHSWFLVFKTRPSGWAFVLGEKLWRRSRKIPGRCLRLFLFVLYFFCFISGRDSLLYFPGSVSHFITTQNSNFHFLVKYSILNIFMSPLLSLGSKGHITLKWSGRTLKSLSQVKYSIFNILPLWSKGHITLKWSSHTQVSQLQFTSESECFWELPPPPALSSKKLIVWMWKHKMS